ncbi:MAG: serine acetyltransferase [Deltaproteobacteria bacterium]|nr:serine acetyltransferase [Deltaproteobacteria bacterium]
MVSGGVDVRPSDDPKLIRELCEREFESHVQYRKKLPDIVDSVVASCRDERCFEHINTEVIPSRSAVIDLVHRIQDVLFPGYFSRERIDPVNLPYRMGQSITELFELLGEQIANSLRYECNRYNKPCISCNDVGLERAICFLKTVPMLREILATDVRAAYDGDPAAKSYDEIIFSYPGVFAIMVYRIAHELYMLDVPFLPRIMTEYAHSTTGIDIHPGARIGERFFIDHGTGVVIGETTEIGRNVRLYQGVTLGALSLPKDAGPQLRGKKRHPTIEDDVIIYAEATILGEKAVIGARSVIGGNVWITEPVPPDTRVMLEAPRLIYK